MRPKTPFLLAALALATSADARSLTLRFPRFSVPPHADREVCTFVPVPVRQAVDVAGISVVNVGGNGRFISHHFLMWSYSGTSMAAFEPRKVVDSQACNDFGPPDVGDRSLLVTVQHPRTLETAPPGLATHLEPIAGSAGPVLGLILNSHWVNASNRRQRASVVVKLIPAAPHTVKRYVKSIFETTADAFIDVPPGQVSSAARGEWAPGTRDQGSTGFSGAPVPAGTACVTSLTTHMHKRGKLFVVEAVAADQSSRELFRSERFTDPVEVPFDPPLVVHPGEAIRYTCTHDNGVTTAQKLGCEEEPGVAPGQPVSVTISTPLGEHGAAKRCATDADCPAADASYPGRHFTGRCVPARLVFGFTSDDDMCILPGTYYEAIPGAAPGAECELSTLPTID